MIMFKHTPDPDNHHDQTTLTMETQHISLPEILQEFEFFLKGCGFYFDGSIQIIEEDEPTDYALEDKSHIAVADNCIITWVNDYVDEEVRSDSGKKPKANKKVGSQRKLGTGSQAKPGKKSKRPSAKSVSRGR